MKQKLNPDKSIFQKLENWLTQKEKWIFYSVLFLFSVFSMLLFNLRVSEGGDDSTYIIRAVNFLNEGTYPSFQGPIYPMYLSIFVAMFGINLGILKLSSFAAILTGIILFYKFFKNRVSYTILFTTLILISVCSYFVYFSSQTYSEGLFFLIQLPIFALIFKLIESKKEMDWQNLLLLSFFILLGYLTRTVGVGALVAVIIFFLIDKKYKHAGLVTGGFILLLFGFLLMKSLIWNNGFFDGNQASTLMYKHPYQLDQGKETFAGFIHRFIDNSNLYLSKHFLKMTGLRAASIKTTNGLFSILLYGLFIVALVKAFKRNKYVLFTAIYVAAMLGITFIVLQKLWDQYRLIIPFVPYMVLVLLYGLYQIADDQKEKWPKRLWIGLVLICTLGTAFQSFNKADLLTLRTNIKGDKYKGYTDDWRHYLSMAEFVGDKLPEEALVAVRKPNMARIYADGKKFYGIYRFDTDDPDQLLKRLKDKNVTHVIMASLRKNPAVNNGQTINTIHRYLYFVSQKYPEIFKLEHQIGKDEPAYLFRVNYDAAK